MHALLKSFVAGCLAATLTSCDYVVRHHGFVRDDQTGKSIKNATITFDHEQYKTDSLGYFEINYIGGRPDRHFVVEKTSYISGHLTIEYDDGKTFYGLTSSEQAQEAPHNSMNFKVTDDTLTFYLKKVIE